MPRSAARRAVPVVALAVLAACSSDRATGPATTPPFDVGQVLAGAALPGVASTAALGAIGAPTGAFAGLLGATSAAPRNCAWSDAAQAFACAPTTANGLTFTYAYTPLDAGGHAQRTPDRTTTDALRTTHTVQGTLAAPGATSATITIDERQTATIRGLLAGPRTVDGTMTLTSSTALAGGPTTRLQLTQTTTGLVLPDGTSPWPKAGTVTSDVLDPATGQHATHSVMTFNGTSIVGLVFTTAGVTQRCTLDLAATSATSGLHCSAG